MKDEKKKVVKQEDVDNAEDTKDFVLTDEFSAEELAEMAELDGE